MTKLSFRTIRFKEENGNIKVIFLDNYYFYLDKNKVKNIDEFKIEKNSIIFENISQKKAENKFMQLLKKGFKDLKNQITGRRTIYIHQNSGIPLIGHNAFGIIDRGTNLIEIRMNTGCNLDCVYCSVWESNPKKIIDFVVEKDYLVEELKKLINFKQCDDIEIHINAQGEPLLYRDLVELIKDLKKIKEVKRISIDTNGVLLNKEKIDKLIKAGLTQFNLSINAIDEKLAKKIANCAYNSKHILKIAEYIAKKGKLFIAPVYVKGVNDKEMEKIIKFAKKLKAKLGIQNYLKYKLGKKRFKQTTWNEFYEMLKRFEKKHNIRLIYHEKDFNIKKCRTYNNPFKKGEIVKVDVVENDRFANKMIGVAKDRAISVNNCTKKGKIKAKIVRRKHNIITALVM